MLYVEIRIKGLTMLGKCYKYGCKIDKSQELNFENIHGH